MPGRAELHEIDKNADCAANKEQVCDKVALMVGVGSRKISVPVHVGKHEHEWDGN